MPSDSERPWRALALREEGGFAGLRRGCRLEREQLDGLHQALLDAVLTGLPPPPADRPPGPDGQRLLIEIDAQGGQRTLSFDRADLPDAVQALLALVRRIAPWKPLPY